MDVDRVSRGTIILYTLERGFLILEHSAKGGLAVAMLPLAEIAVKEQQQQEQQQQEEQQRKSRSSNSSSSSTMPPPKSLY